MKTRKVLNHFFFTIALLLSMAANEYLPEEQYLKGIASTVKIDVIKQESRSQNVNIQEAFNCEN